MKESCPGWGREGLGLWYDGNEKNRGLVGVSSNACICFMLCDGYVCLVMRYGKNS